MSTLPDSGSRTCASFFPAGGPTTGVYLVGNQCSDCGRDPVTLSLSTDGISFDRHFAVRHGVKGADIDHGGSCPRFKGAAKGCGYQYPGAMIDEARKEMIVSYSIGKEDIGLTVFPLSALKSDDGGAAAVPLLPGHPQQNASWSYVGEPWVVSAFGDWAEPVRGFWSEAPEHAIAEDGNFAFYTQRAFTTFSASATFRMLAPWSGAAFVFGAANASSFFQVEFPSTGQQARAEHAWVTLSSVDSAGIRTARYLHGPVGGVTSQPGFEHTMQVTLDESAMLHVRIDGRPIPAYHLPEALENPGYVGFGTCNMVMLSRFAVLPVSLTRKASLLQTLCSGQAAGRLSPRPRFRALRWQRPRHHLAALSRRGMCGRTFLLRVSRQRPASLCELHPGSFSATTAVPGSALQAVSVSLGARTTVSSSACAGSSTFPIDRRVPGTSWEWLPRTPHVYGGAGHLRVSEEGDLESFAMAPPLGNPVTIIRSLSTDNGRS